MLTLLLLPFGCSKGDFPDVLVTNCEFGACAVVTWTTSEPATSKVEWGPDATEIRYDHVTPGGDELTTEHAVLVVGPTASADWWLRATSETSNGTRFESSDLAFRSNDPDTDLGAFTTEIDLDTSTEAPLLFTTVGQASAVLIADADGGLIWWRDMPPSWVVAQAVASGGTEVVFNVADATRADGTMSEVIALRLDGAEVRTPTPDGHHDFVRLDDGGYAYIKADMRLYDVDGDGVMETVAGDAIVEVAADGTVLHEVWTSWDWLPVSVTHETDTGFYPDALDWLHGNGLVLVDDAYYLSSHALSTVFKIDRATGNQIWRIGRRESDFTFVDGAEPFEDQHSPRWVDGDLYVFNNRTSEQVYSYAVQYALDESTMTATEVRRYNGDGASYSYVLGNVDVLEGEHWLVSWGTNGRIEEIDADNNVVRQILTGLGFPVGNAHYTGELGGPIQGKRADESDAGCATVPVTGGFGLVGLFATRRRGSGGRRASA